jgi:hypothetical protein
VLVASWRRMLGTAVLTGGADSSHMVSGSASPLAAEARLVPALRVPVEASHVGCIDAESPRQAVSEFGNEGTWEDAANIDLARAILREGDGDA